MINNSTDNIIDELMKESKIYRFASELEYVTKNNNNDDNKRKEDIQSILRVLQGIQNNTCTARDKLNDIYSKIDECSYKKKWTRLQEMQKIKKVKEFLLSLISDTANRHDVETQIIDEIKQGGLKTAKHVTYDITTSNILSIVNLTKNEKTKKYEFIKKLKTKVKE